MNVLFDRVDNTKIIVFRILFGLLMVAESWGAIATGWVAKTFVDVNMTFNFIGFDWTQVLLGEPMYYIYLIMGFLGLLVSFGAFYRISTILLFLLWTLTYLMQKSNYNNHYYLIVWLSFIMTIIPAHYYYSIDDRIFNLRDKTCPRWCIIIIQILVSVVYIFAAIAKLYPGWYNNHFLPIRLNNSAYWFENKFGENMFSELLRTDWLSQFLAYAGIGFDFLIIPLLLFKPTRKIAFFSALLFHLFNAITLHIGIFPFLALALTLFFFDTEDLKHQIFPFKGRGGVHHITINSPKRKLIIQLFLIIFISLHIYLPLRHWMIKDDVLWTEEGHRMAWRMMLRTKSGQLKLISENTNGQREEIILSDYLKPHQIQSLNTHPDMIWQFAQRLKKEKGGKVYVENSIVSINGGPYHPFINDTIDIGNTKWKYFGHQEWILDSPESYY